MGKNLKDQAMKQLASSRAAELVAKPGRLPETRKTGAFLYRVRKGRAQESAKVMAAAQLLQERLWVDVAASALLALERIFGIQRAKSRVRAVEKGKVLPNLHGARLDLTRAHDMLRTLLDFMNDRAAEAMVAQLILNDKGELRAEELYNLQDERRREIPGEEPTSLWAKPASDDPVVRLRR